MPDGSAAARPRRPPAARPAPRIRWDRVGRVALLGVFVAIVLLYLGPVRAWVGAYREAGERREQVAELREHNRALRARERELRRVASLEREARKLGMVKAGERAYVVEGLPR